MSLLSLDPLRTISFRVCDGLAIVLLLCLAPCVQASGVASTAGSCEYADVKTALDSAPEGSTVTIPAGDCTWGQTPIQRYGGVWLKGAGMGQTVIRAASVTNPDATSGLLLFLCWNNHSGIEISDISFLGDQNSSGYNGGVVLNSGCRDFKIHNNAFQDFKGEALSIEGANGSGGDSRGVVYNNRFVGNLVSGSGYGVNITSDDRWASFKLGDQNPDAVFVEDNYFESNRHSVAANYGARYVVRHNTFVTTRRNWGLPVIDAHGIQDAVFKHGTRSWEVYNNTLSIQGAPPAGVTTGAEGIKMRGGDGLVYNNTIDAGFKYSVVLRLEWYLNGDEQCNAPGGDPTDGTVPGIAGPWPADWLGQTRTAWIWGNTWGAASQSLKFDGCEFYFHDGRDFFQHAPTSAELGYNYQPFAYPHPLRGADEIFQQGFE